MNFSNVTATAHCSIYPQKLTLPMQTILHNRTNMMNEAFKEQLEGLIAEYQSACEQSPSGGLSRTPVVDLITRLTAAIERIAGRDSTYFRQINELDNKRLKRKIQTELSDLVGIAKALLSDIQNDYMVSFEEIVRGDLFGDFLEMATQLIDDNKNKDAAAVLAGSTLDAHIKQLCDKYRVTTTSGKKRKNADTLNAELVKAGVYTKLDQKNVTAWLGLRNNAVHGNYSEYTMDQVKLFVDGIRNFITRILRDVVSPGSFRLQFPILSRPESSFFSQSSSCP